MFSFPRWVFVQVLYQNALKIPHFRSLQIIGYQVLNSYPKELSLNQDFSKQKKGRFLPLLLLSMPHACKKCGRLKKSRPTAQTFYNGAKVRYFFRSCKFPLKNLRKMSFTTLDLFGACWMRSSTSKSKLIVITFVVLPLPFGVLFHLLFFSSCSIIFLFLLFILKCPATSAFLLSFHPSMACPPVYNYL